MKTLYKVSWSNTKQDYFSTSFNTEEKRAAFIKNLSTKNIHTWENQVSA